jgi:hypothetical protein
VCVPIELVGKEGLHLVASVDPWGQTNGVQHDKVNTSPQWARAEVGGG